MFRTENLGIAGNQIHRRKKARVIIFKDSVKTMYFLTPAIYVRVPQFVVSAIILGIFVFLLNTTSFAQNTDDPIDAVAVFNQAQDLHEKGDLAGAIKLYDQALKILPEFPEAEYQRGVAELALGKDVEAEKSFRRAIELRADWTLPMTSLGSLLVKKGSTNEAESILTKVLEIEPQNPPAIVALSDLRRRSNSSPEVLQQLLTAITALTSKANPTASLWSARADLELALGRRNEAKTSIATALAIDPKYRWALFQAANFALSDGDMSRARQIVANIEALTPDSDSLNSLRASIAAAEGNLDAALKFLDAIKTPGTEAIDLRKQLVAESSQDPVELAKQLESDPKNSLLLGRLCTLYRTTDPAKALDYCRRANEVEPNNVRHAVGYGAALVQAKQFEASVSLLRRIIEKAPDNWTAHANLATALFQLKRYPEAKAEFLWLTNAQPKTAGAYLFLGIIFDQLGEYLDALANYQQYLRLADPLENKLDIDKVNLRLPVLQKLVKDGKGKK